MPARTAALGERIRADLVTNIVQPGRFITIEQGLVFHLRERQANGLLLGIFLDDRRNPQEASTFLAERGEIVREQQGHATSLLVDGSVQRHQADQRDPTIVKFERYAFDLSQFSSPTQTQNLSTRELYLWELIAPAPDEPNYAQSLSRFRVELHDRLIAPIYPIAFAIIAFAWLGAPSTTRQSRAMAMLAMIVRGGRTSPVGICQQRDRIQRPRGAGSDSMSWWPSWCGSACARFRAARRSSRPRG